MRKIIILLIVLINSSFLAGQEIDDFFSKKVDPYFLKCLHDLPDSTLKIGSWYFMKTKKDLFFIYGWDSFLENVSFRIEKGNVYGTSYGAEGPIGVIPFPKGQLSYVKAKHVLINWCKKKKESEESSS